MNSPVKYVLSGAAILIMALLMIYYFNPGRIQSDPPEKPEKTAVDVQEEPSKTPDESETFIDAAQTQNRLQQALLESRSACPPGFT